MPLDPDAPDPSPHPVLQLGEVNVIPTQTGDPGVLIAGEQRFPVAEVTNRWRVDDLRYYRPRTAIYFAVVLEAGDLVTLSHDRTEGTWEIHRVG